MKLSIAIVRLLVFTFFLVSSESFAQTVIRCNQLGYTPGDFKVVVTASKDPAFRLERYVLKNLRTNLAVLQVLQPANKDFGAFGPFSHTYRIDLSGIEKPGEYQLIVNDSIRSPLIRIDHKIYRGKADLCLNFLKNQRCGLKPLVGDTCHPEKSYTVGGPLPDSTAVDAAGGWHNAGDFEQQVMTAAVTTWNLLATFRQFPALFNDAVLANGKTGRNDQPDILDEAKWGLDWLIKMHPAKDLMFSRLGDTVFTYQRGNRPLYFVGINSLAAQSKTGLAGQLSATFSLGSMLMKKAEINYRDRLEERAENAYRWALEAANEKVGNVSGEKNVLALAAGELYQLTKARKYLDDEKKFGRLSFDWHRDNLQLVNYLSNSGKKAATCMQLKPGIERVNEAAKKNAFLHGLPFVEGSNYLAVAFANQCYSYRTYCNDSSFAKLEQATIDWLFGCNPWGVTMIAGMPGTNAVESPYGFWGMAGFRYGLVAGPVKASVYQSSKGASLLKKDEYAAFQSELAVYHDDKADYVTNEPTLDGTAALLYLLAAKEHEALANAPGGLGISEGVVIRGDSAQKKVALVFVSDSYTSGGKAIRQILSKEGIKASFFLTDRFVKSYPSFVRLLKSGGHYIGPHENAEAEPCEGPGCDTLMAAELFADIQANYAALRPFGITQKNAPVFLPNSGKYNDALSARAEAANLSVINATPGTLSMQDNSLPGTPGYTGSDSIFQSVMKKVHQMPYGLKGYFLVFHLDADADRSDKFYLLLPLLLQELKNENYKFVRADEMLGLKAPPVYRAPAKRKKRR